jgi:aminoglycoside 2'-N-acetyltransferase I
VTVPTPAGLTVEVLRTSEVPGSVLDRVRAIMTAAFAGRFDEHDWAHALGGTHVLASIDGVVLAHAAVVPRSLDVDGVAFRAGYVEAVATAPSHQGHGIGTAVMTTASDLVRSAYDLGALSTGRPSFYERLGWERWAGTTWVRTAGGLVRTPDEDDGILVLRTGPSAALALTGAIACEARPGDDW